MESAYLVPRGITCALLDSPRPAWEDGEAGKPPRKGALLLAGFWSRLTYANVTATLALAAALGGGLAVAGGGGGAATVVGAHARDIAVISDETKLVTLPGVVRVKGTCFKGDVQPYLKNLSGRKLTVVFAIQGADDASEDELEPGGAGESFPFGSDTVDHGTLHLFPAGGARDPVASISVTTTEGATCATSEIAVTAIGVD